MAGLNDVIRSELPTLLHGIAPLLANVLLGPAGGIVVGLLGNCLGVDSKDLDKMATTIKSSPDAAVKIKQIELEHLDVLRQLASDDYKSEITDRMDARKNIIVYKDFLRHMAYLITLGFFASLFLMFLPVSISGEEKNLLSMLVGMLASKWQTIIDFFYGSSRHNSQGEAK